MSASKAMLDEVVTAIPRLGSKRWSTKEGAIIRVRDMEHRHALNTRSLMLRQVQSFLSSSSFQAAMMASMAGGDMATFELETQSQRYASADPEALLDATPLGGALAKRIAKGDGSWGFPYLPDPKAGCTCTWHSEDRSGGHFETVPEYDPACPEHSTHLYDPRQGMWIEDPR